MSSQLVSVVIPAYNVERYVATAVRSALEQTHGALEVIVVDDGSTDGTTDALAEFGASITVLNKENGGIGSARNHGIRAARGEIIAFLDADDLWLPERVTRCLDQLAQADAAFVTSDAALIDEAGVALGACYSDLEPFPARDLAQEIVRRNYVFVSVLVRRNALDRVGHFDEGGPTGAEDYDMWLRLVANGCMPSCVREPLAGYRIRHGSLTTQAGGLTRARNRALARNLPTFWKQGIYGPANQALDVAWDLARSGRLQLAARFASNAFKDPDRDGFEVMAGAVRAGVRRCSRTRLSGDVEHALQGDACPLRRLRVDGDLVHHLAAHE